MLAGLILALVLELALPSSTPTTLTNQEVSNVTSTNTETK